MKKAIKNIKRKRQDALDKAKKEMVLERKRIRYHRNKQPPVRGFAKTNNRAIKRRKSEEADLVNDDPSKNYYNGRCDEIVSCKEVWMQAEA